jgi:hypothetical protein
MMRFFRFLCLLVAECCPKWWYDVDRDIIDLGNSLSAKLSKLAMDEALPYAELRCERDGSEWAREGVWVPELRSFEAAQARNTASRIEGVKRDSVWCDSDRAARRRRFF